jgi:hypothetical protein
MKTGRKTGAVIGRLPKRFDAKPARNLSKSAQHMAPPVFGQDDEMPPPTGFDDPGVSSLPDTSGYVTPAMDPAYEAAQLAQGGSLPTPASAPKPRPVTMAAPHPLAPVNVPKPATGFLAWLKGLFGIRA